MRKLAVLFFILLPFLLLAQHKNKINPNGYNVFYYPNGFKASEGYMRNGKPDGYWITYYVNGQKKSEGNRKNFLLDSLWIFYNELGDTTKKIWYRNGKKNGYYITYYTSLDSDFIANIPKSKILYVDDVRQGKAYFYYPSGKLHYVVPYENNYKNGTGYEYAEDGRIIGILEYRNDILVSYRAVNRYDDNGQKTGTWIELYPNGKIKYEITYKNGLPDGYYREYLPSGQLSKVEIYKNGKIKREISADSLYKSNIIQIEKHYPNGQIKAILTYKDSLPVGIHKFFDQNGNLVKAIWYSDDGIKLGEGLVDTLDRKQGKWILFYPEGIKFAEGFYKNNLPDSNWVYFYRNGQIMQTGKYRDSVPVGLWKMYYQTGQLLKQEYFDDYGYRQGLYFELKPNGDTAVRGFYKDGMKTGNWFYNIGDEMSKGKYGYDKKVGLWLYYYMPEQILKCKINYFNGLPDGKFICYYKNKKPQVRGYYYRGKKEKKWYFYNPDGTLKYTITYKYDKMIKINDIPIK